MKVNVNFTVELDEIEYGEVYGAKPGDYPVKDIREEVRSDAQDSTMAWLDRVGVKSAVLIKYAN